MMTISLLVIFLAAALPGFDGATLRIGVFVTPDALSVWRSTKQGTFASFKSSMQGTVQSEISSVFRTSQGFPWNVDVRFVTVEQVSQSKVNQWMQTMATTRNPSAMAKDFCTYVNGVKGSSYDVGMLIISKAERDNNGLAPAATASIGTMCKAERNLNCMYMYGQIERWSQTPVWHMLMGHELGHLFGGWHPDWNNAACHDIMAGPNRQAPDGRMWGSCSTPKIREVQRSGDLRCVGL